LSSLAHGSEQRPELTVLGAASLIQGRGCLLKVEIGDYGGIQDTASCVYEIAQATSISQRELTVLRRGNELLRQRWRMLERKDER
jgi:hypothetical protein